MNVPTPQDAHLAMTRLSDLADRAFDEESILEFDGQDANDVRTIAARLEFLESLRMSAIKFTAQHNPTTDDLLRHTPGQPTLGLPTVADYARKKRAKALGDETSWGDSQ